MIRINSAHYNISNEILIDSGATHHLFHSLHYVKPYVVVNNDTDYNLQGVHVGHTLKITHKGLIPNVGNFVVAPDTKTVLISVGQLTMNGFVVSFQNDTAILTRGDLCIIGTRYNIALYRLSHSQLLQLTSKPLKLNKAIMYIENTLQNLTDSGFSFIPPIPVVTTTANTSPVLIPLVKSNENEMTVDIPVVKSTANYIYSKEQKQRALEVNKLHISMAHPSDKTLMYALDNGLIIGTRLIAHDVRVARVIYGPCLFCLAGNITKPIYKTSLTPPAIKVGGAVHVDIYPFDVKTIGGYKLFLVCVDEFSGFLHVIALKSKKTKKLTAGFRNLIASYYQYHHQIKVIHADHESCFTACNEFLGTQGIILRLTPPYQHAQRIERYVRTINNKVRTVLSSLPYELPPKLYGELLLHVVSTINDLPLTLQLTQTPRQMFQLQKLDLNTRLLIPFGTLAMMHVAGREQQKFLPRSELGVVLGQSHLTYHAIRAYNIDSDRIVTRHHVTVLDRIPSNFIWKLRKNTKMILNLLTPSNPILPDSRPQLSEAVPGDSNYLTDSETEPDITSSVSEGVIPSIDDHTSTGEGAFNDHHNFPQSARVEELVEPVVPILVVGSTNTKVAFDAYDAHNQMEDSDIRTIPTNITNQPVPKQTLSAEGALKRNSNQITESEPADWVDSPSQRKLVRNIHGKKTKSGNVHASTDHTSTANIPLPLLTQQAKTSVSLNEDQPRYNGSPKQSSNRPVRTNRTSWRDGPVKMNQMIAEMYRTSIAESQKGEHAQESREAIIAEIQNMISYKVGHFIRFADIKPNLRQNILNCFMFMKDKTKPDGTYDRTKARMVILGNHQKKHMYDIISSSTIGLAVVFLLFNIASCYRALLASYDVKGAFLNAQYGPNDAVTYVRINKKLTDIWITIEPLAAAFVDDRGELMLELDKFIYGLKQAPHKFQEHLKASLISIGYEQQVNDDCLFIKRNGTNFSIISTHVDDILQVSTSEQLVTELHEGLVNIYGTITYTREADAYLGMTIKRSVDKSTINITQLGLVNKILDKYLENKSGVAPSPASEKLFEKGQSKSVPVDRTLYLGLIMSLMYLARLTRPDILLAVTFLATRSHCADTRDLAAARRILYYLNSTKDLGVTINCCDLQVNCTCDASHAVHQDGKSHTGYIISLGSTKSYLHSRSGKQKLVATSSTDAELIAMVEGLKQAYWLREIITMLHITPLAQIVLYQNDDSQIILFQDNKSAIMMIEEPSKYKRSKHLLTKISYARDLVTRGIVRTIYLCTAEMTADTLTKPLQGSLYLYHRLVLLGN